MKARATYTIRGIPPDVDQRLRKKASQLKQSLNQVVVEELTRATVGHRTRCDFSDLVGRWTPDPKFEAVIAEQRRIDRNRWT